MADTVHHQPSPSQFIEIVSGTGNEIFVQNVSKTPKAAAMLIWGTSVPVADAQGHIIKPGEAVVRNGLTGKLYARGVTTDVTLAVSEE